ncbi:MAG: 4Fe-4S dicluster domain-containing protein [Firmicutes bacterium]|nr:4Fe-4S dicluster domain-containing protein [Bacillota bacterium]
MGRRWIPADPEKCSGCRICEVICNMAHDHQNLINPSWARIHVYKEEEAGKDIPKTCLQCENADCARACPAGAIYFDPPLGAYLVAEDLCSGCGECVQACSFGAIFLHPARQVAVKCDLCGGAASCIKECPTGALTLAEGD